ncbi:MAG: iron export ABC transporter permease subunit FetB [Burkholderiales bacterium]|nr:iron export ABC transporter permease subunit FetB [Burkholderiales bacterium]
MSGELHPFDISWLRLMAAAVLVLVALALSLWQRLGLGKGLVVGAIRATVQLVAVGYVLVWLFAADRWYLVLAVLGLMVAVATHTAARRQAKGAAERRTILPIAGLAILAGAGLTLAYVTAVVIHVSPWYNPRYLIPLFGMIVANSMNAAALALERLASEMDAHRAEVEAWLALGATPGQASAEAARRATVAAMIPAVNALAVVGVVSLPGMMTGQILAGADPALAVRYQLVVMFMLTAATGITAAIAVQAYRRTFFTPAAQLKPRAPA